MSGPHETAPRDRTTRQAALWATAVAVPVAALVAVFAINQLSPEEPAAAPTPSPSVSASAPRPQSSAPVAMAAPPLADRAGTVCRALLSRLPAQVRDLSQRPVTAGHEQNAAYGDPAVTVACGIPLPSFPPTDLVYPLDRVCWHAGQRPDATVWTTVDREVPVQVTIPKTYDEPGQWVIPFSAPVIAAVPSAKTIPTGCGG
ncbi:Protein of unknown function [Micromonospora pattaloongensis]|uniref:DUF3515 domain-containing protein n=1 Tax=Micromonospora pattaloongensis TaxID=405436 RepID=A0A1H3KUY7_9ACTN|nr:DUF3515 family protein [Micromonospora pattaloongensis]SDY55568.1 Protein of unknown function [Micromonospora pattaloongensis]